MRYNGDEGFYLVSYKDHGKEVIYLMADGVIILNDGEHFVYPEEDQYSKYVFERLISTQEAWEANLGETVYEL